MGYGGRGYGYTEGGYGYGVSDFVGVADVLRGLGGDPYSAWALRRLSGRYGGPVARLRRSSDNAELDFYGQGSLGLVSTDAVRAWNGWNLAAYTGDMTSAIGWNRTFGGIASSPTAALSGFTPDGFPATRLVFNLNGGTTSDERSLIANNTGPTSTPVIGATYTISFMAKSFDSNTYTMTVSYGSTASYFQVTPTWQRFTFLVVASNTGRLTFELRGNRPTTNSDFADVLIGEAQSEQASSFSTYEPRTTTGAGSSFLVALYDQSGNGDHFTQSTTTLQPIVCESGVVVTEGGRVAAKFVAADARRMAVASSTARFNFLHTTGGSVAAVSRANDTAAFKSVLTSVNAASTNIGLTYGFNGNESSVVQVGQGTAVVMNTATTVTGWTTPEVKVLLIDPDNATQANRLATWRNGSSLVSTDSGTASVASSNAAANLTLGARGNGTNPFDGTIQDILVWDMLISDAVRDAYEADAGRFYSITVA